MKVMTPEQIYSAENNENAEGLSYESMMRTAGNNLAAIIKADHPAGGNTVVVCGKGKNGGDGIIAANKLSLDPRFKVSVILAFGEPTEELSRKMFGEIDRSVTDVIDFSQSPDECYALIAGADLIVDAIFGIGFAGSVSDAIRPVFEAINASKAKRISVDIPSGLIASVPAVPELFVHADSTVTMLCAKPAVALLPSRDCCGKITVAGIGFTPPETSFGYEVTDREYVRSLFKPRAKDSNKGSYGRVAAFCGSAKMPGAAVLAAKAAVETGCGLYKAIFPKSAYKSIASQLTEPILMPFTNGRFMQFLSKMGFDGAAGQLSGYLKGASVFLAGCGIGRTEDTVGSLKDLLSQAKCPVVLDADALNIAAKDTSMIKNLGVPLLITPHPGEMSRLTHKSIAEIQSDRIGTALEAAKKFGCAVLLKGCDTVICSPAGRVVINPTGNPGMARGGSGDILSGIIASFIAQGLDVFDAAVAGAYIHGLAGDIAADKYTQFCSTPLRLIEELPAAFKTVGV
ncbi:MAG: NAD(P)H-hydrate dehydratase [Clostridia bacterium]|nr:NAD(P)H-hydrate dehydratase [Clostridia bacterium]